MSQQDLKAALDILNSVLAKRTSKDFRTDLNSRPHVIPLSNDFMFELIGGQDYIQRRQEMLKNPALERLMNQESMVKDVTRLQEAVKHSIEKVAASRIAKGTVTRSTLKGLGPSLIIDGNVSNYAVVSKIFQSAFNKTNLGESAYNTLGAIYGYRVNSVDESGKKTSSIQDSYLKEDGEGSYINTHASVAIDVGHLFASAAVNVTDSRKGLARRIDYIGRSNPLFDPSKAENEIRTQILKKLKSSLVDTVTEGVLELDARLSLVRKLASNKGRYSDTLEGRLVVVFPQAAVENQAFGKTLAKLENTIVTEVENRLLSVLPDMKGSKSYVQILDTLVDRVLEGESYKDEAKSSAGKKLTVRVKETQARLKPIRVKPPKYNVATAIIKGKQVNRLKSGGKFASISSLLAHINALLPKYIQDNMGRGGAKSVLNYRTGRFARSVKLLKLDVTRDVAVNAFYTYMKYPYQTFEPGFQQGTIKSRDPRLLIQKAIRQIVTEAFQQQLNIKFTRN